MDKKMILCPKGHYYDKDKSSQCPICRITRPVLETKPASQPAESGAYNRVSKSSLNNITVPVLGDKKSQNPVVGWLVTISGPFKGKDYRLFSGYNSIGRSNKNKIHIAGDESISREKQAIIIYDHKNIKYYIQHNESENLSYINSNPVLQPTEIKKGDKITIGKTEFLFVPFCDSTFSWPQD
jgi:FHA domain